MKHHISILATGLVLSMLAATTAASEAVTASHSSQATFASVERELQRGDEAIALARLQEQRKGLRHDGDIARNASLTCQAYLQLQRHKEAINACSIAIDSRAASWSDYNNRGAASLMLGETAAAISDLHQANMLRRGVSSVRRNLALARRIERQRHVAANP